MHSPANVEGERKETAQQTWDQDRQKENELKIWPVKAWDIGRDNLEWI